VVLTNLDKNGIFIKMMFDGHDFMQHEIGSILTSKGEL